MTEREIAPYEKFLLTTSRKPSQRTRSFLRDLVRVIPWSFHFTRGTCSLNDLADELASLGINRMLIIHEKKGNPSLVKFYKLDENELVEGDYRMRIKGIALDNNCITADFFYCSWKALTYLLSNILSVKIDSHNIEENSC